MREREGERAESEREGRRKRERGSKKKRRGREGKFGIGHVGLGGKRQLQNVNWEEGSLLPHNSRLESFVLMSEPGQKWDAA